MKISQLLLFFAALHCLSSEAQVQFSVGNKLVYGQQGRNEVTEDLLFTINGDFLLAGSDSGKCSIRKVDANGLEQWNKSYLGDSSLILSIQYAPDGNFISAGTFGSQNGFLLKTDDNGDSLWSNVSDTLRGMKSMKMIGDSNLVIVGAYPGMLPGEFIPYAKRFDLSGNFIDDFEIPSQVAFGEVNDVLVLNSGDFIFSATRDSSGVKIVYQWRTDNSGLISSGLIAFAGRALRLIAITQAQVLLLGEDNSGSQVLLSDVNMVNSGFITIPGYHFHDAVYFSSGYFVLSGSKLINTDRRGTVFRVYDQNLTSVNEILLNDTLDEFPQRVLYNGNNAFVTAGNTDDTSFNTSDPYDQFLQFFSFSLTNPGGSGVITTLKVYPTLFSDHFYFEADFLVPDLVSSLQIADLSGRIIPFRYDLQAGKFTIYFDPISNGAYFYKLIHNGKTYRGRLVRME